jgi:hypothetical protein
LLDTREKHPEFDHCQQYNQQNRQGHDEFQRDGTATRGTGRARAESASQHGLKHSLTVRQTVNQRERSTHVRREKSP